MVKLTDHCAIDWGKLTSNVVARNTHSFLVLSGYVTPVTSISRPHLFTYMSTHICLSGAQYLLYHTPVLHTQVHCWSRLTASPRQACVDRSWGEEAAAAMHPPWIWRENEKQRFKLHAAGAPIKTEQKWWSETACRAENKRSYKLFWG